MGFILFLDGVGSDVTLPIVLYVTDGVVGPGGCIALQAKEHGFGMVGTFNTCTSTGSIGYYAKKIADAGFISFCFAQSPEVRWVSVIEMTLP